MHQLLEFCALFQTNFSTLKCQCHCCRTLFATLVYGFLISGRLVSNLRFTDDITLVSSSEAELQELVILLYWAVSDMGMRINVKKTEVMKVCDDDTPPMSFTINDEPILEVSSFTYLGATFSSEALYDEEIKSRLALARERVAKLDPLWRSRAISAPLKARLIQTLVWPIVTYGAEAWTLSKDLQATLRLLKCNVTGEV